MEKHTAAQIIQGNLCGLALKKNIFKIEEDHIELMTQFNNHVAELSKLAADRIYYHSDSFNRPTLGMFSKISKVVVEQLLVNLEGNKEMGFVDLYEPFCWTSFIDNHIEQFNS